MMHFGGLSSESFMVMMVVFAPRLTPPYFIEFGGDILKASANIEFIDPAYKNSFSIKVSNGSNVSFWKDTWCRDGIRLMDVFPRLFALGSSQDCSVCDRWHLVDELWTSNWNWRIRPHGRSLGDLDFLISLLGKLSLSPDGVDIWQWNFKSSGKFKGSSKRLPTRSNLESRGVPIPSVMCPFYDNDMEMIAFFIVITWSKCGGNFGFGGI
ncbi:hypothetical protein Tco_0778822 [Tanacetum coccineum]